MARKALVAVVLSFLIMACEGVQLGPRHTKQDPGSSPAVVDHYAAEVIRVGGNWRIFLHARDQDSDMKYIAAVLYQAGVNYYSTHFTFLKEADRAEFAGYLVLPIPSDYSFYDDRFDMRVLVRDHEDNKSEDITLPLRIGHWTYEDVPEKWEQAANNRLGIIIVDLESSKLFNKGEHRRGN
jgi:hypothetical protein